MVLILINQNLQQAKKNIEKLAEHAHCIFIDNASSDGAWDWVSVEAVRRKHLLVSRNRKKLSLKFNIINALRFVNPTEKITIKDGDYAVPFDVFKKYLKPRDCSTKEDRQTEPLVSITVHNYNYGRYLSACLGSLVSQTYKNIEIIFSDNASSDDSWAVACEYAKKYPKIITLTRNHKNLGPQLNLENCLVHVRGKYRIEMCSDDYLEPTCIETCVKAFRKYPKVGFVMFHRNIIDQEGHLHKELPFYDGSYLIEGIQQAAVYMLAAVNPSISQVVYDTEKSSRVSSEDSMLSRWWGARIKDFKMCLEHPVIYISDPLLGHRDHPSSDSKSTEGAMLEIFGPLLLAHSFVEWSNKHPIIVNRFDKSLEKLAGLCLRYSSRALSRGEHQLAKRYFQLSKILATDVENLNLYKLLESFFAMPDGVRSSNLLRDILDQVGNLTRVVSYPPPEGSRRIKI